jgi:hypothetical protein
VCNLCDASLSCVPGNEGAICDAGKRCQDGSCLKPGPKSCGGKSENPITGGCTGGIKKATLEAACASYCTGWVSTLKCHHSVGGTNTIGGACSNFDFNTCSATDYYWSGSGQQHCVVGGYVDGGDDDGDDGQEYRVDCSCP